MTTFKKIKKKAVKYVKKRYGGKNSMKNMMTDINRLKMIINSEKKQHVQTNTPGVLRAVGAVNGDSNGCNIFPCHPYPSQGVGDSQRTGDSIKLVSGMMNLRFSQQANTVNKVQLILELWHTAKPVTDVTNDFLKLLYLDDPTMGGTDVITMSSHQDQDYKSLFTKVMTRKVTIGQDRTTNARDVTTVKIPLKINKGFGQHFKFAEGTTATSVGQYCLIVRANRGNASTSVVSTLGGAIDTAINTGIEYAHNITWYYYDN